MPYPPERRGQTAREIVRSAEAPKRHAASEVGTPCARGRGELAFGVDEIVRLAGLPGAVPLGERHRLNDAFLGEDGDSGRGARPGGARPAPPPSSRDEEARNLAVPGPLEWRGVGDSEPLASGVTVDFKWMAGARLDSHDAGNTGNAGARSSPFLQRFAAVSRPLGTSLVQPGAINAESVRWVSVRELAAVLRVSTSTVYQAVAAGEIPHVRVSNAIRVAIRALPPGE